MDFSEDKWLYHIYDNGSYLSKICSSLFWDIQWKEVFV